MSSPDESGLQFSEESLFHYELIKTLLDLEATTEGIVTVRRADGTSVQMNVGVVFLNTARKAF
jgi:hypothetical protein